MKYIKAGFGVLVSLLFLGLLLFSGCTNIFAPPEQPGGNNRGGVTISIAGEPPVRTLYPAAEFTKYTLDFSHAASSHAQVVLTGGESSVVLDDLADGEWTVTAKGYVSIDIDDTPDAGPLEFAAARGTKTVTVTGGTADPVTIALDAAMGSDDGYLSWNISIPNDPGIQEAYLEITWLSGNYQVRYPDLLSTPADRQGILKLSPGYYLVQLWVFNGYQRIGHTEVAAVYSNMETTANYTFDGADFVPAVKMSGTVTMANTTGVNYIYVIARNDSGSLDLRSKSVTVDSGDGQYSWEIYTAAPSAPLQIRFDIGVDYTDHSTVINTGKTITLGSTDYPNINLGTVDTATVTIGGTIHFTGIDQTPDYISIYNSLNGVGWQVALGPVSGGVADGTWSMKVLASLAGSEASFSLSIHVGGTSFNKSLGTVTMPGSDDLNIVFSPADLTTVTWSGTIDIAVNGVFPSGYVDFQAYEVNPWQYIGSGSVNSDGTWSITFGNPYEGSKQIAFILYMEGRGIDLPEQTLQATTQSGIDLGTHSYITLSGSVVVTLNGNPITPGNNSNLNVYARPNADYSGSELGYANVDALGNWTMLVEPSSSSRDFYFEVYVYDYNTGRSTRKETGVFRSVSDSQITDIDLGTVDLTVTWSGTIDLTVNGVFPSGSVSIQVYEISDNSWQYIGSGSVNSDGTWSITVSKPYEGSRIFFTLDVEGRGIDLGEQTLPATTQSGIDLGSIAVP